MAIHLVGRAAVIRNGDSTTVILDLEPGVTADLRGVLASVNSVGLGGTSPGVRQLLNDLDAALQRAVPRKPGERAKPKLRRVCEIPDCGCSGYAHA